MTEPIITKQCPKCKQVKPLSEFHKNRRAKDGLGCYCKPCKSLYQKHYRQNGKGKIAQKRYAQSKKGRIVYRTAYKRWSQTEKGKVVFRRTLKRYQQSEKGKAAHKKGILNYQRNHPERIAARKVVNNAIKSGQLPPVNTQKCKCGEQAYEYHHWSYLPEHWLDVEPMCKKCHKKQPQTSI